MKRTVLLAQAAALSAIGFAQPPPGYYDAASGLTGPPLKAALFGIISPHTVHSYAQLWNDFESTDDRDDNGKVWDIYSDIPDSVAPYQYTFGTDQCGSYNSEGDCYNREHTVPQSWFNGDAPMVSDLFHIYPTDGWVNNKRGDPNNRFAAPGDLAHSMIARREASRTFCLFSSSISWACSSQRWMSPLTIGTSR